MTAAEEHSDLEAERSARTHSRAGDQDPVSARTEGRRDYDRLLYSPYFHRLAAVTQVVATTTETALIHNRMTHSLKVAQLSRELSETLVENTDVELIASLGGLDPDVAAAAGLAHDLGHPPWGHIGEQELDKALLEEGVLEGYDGNAQTFRIVTLLGAKKGTLAQRPGLDLSAATRNAVLKYPFPYPYKTTAQDADGETPQEERPTDHKRPKYGYYEADTAEFESARVPHRLAPTSRSLECQVMDLCDDISYAVHDLEDFVRTGVITTALLSSPPAGFDAKVKERTASTFKRRGVEASAAWALADDGWKTATQLLGDEAKLFGPLKTPYRGTTEQQASLSALSSFYIESFLEGVSIREKNADGEIHIDDANLATILTLKTLVRELVINKPTVQLTQVGQRQLMRRVYKGVLAWLRTVDDPVYYPGLLAHIWAVNAAQANARHGSDFQDHKAAVLARTTADFIASLTEAQIVSIDRQLNGLTDNPVLGDWII